MRMRPDALVRLLVFVLLGAAVQAAPRERFAGTDDDWHRYESPHCELYSQVGEGDSRDLLYHLEQLQALFVESMGLRERRAVPVTVYNFARTRDFLAYVPEAMRDEDRVAAYHTRQPDRAVIALSPGWDRDDDRRMIYHEYVHHVMALADEQPPPWYAEGVAEFFSTFRARGNGLMVGDPIMGHFYTFQQDGFMPLAQLFGIDRQSPSYNESARAGLLYAESWLFIHYWMCGQPGLTPEQIKRRNEFFLYVGNETDQGDPERRREVFEAATGRTYDQMLEELKRYAHRGEFVWRKYDLPPIPEASTYATRAVPRDEIRLRLAELDLRINRDPAAKLLLLDAAQRDPADGRSREVLGTDARLDGDDGQAEARWREALAAVSKNPAIYYELAGIEQRRWFSDIDFDLRIPREKAAELRQLLHASLDAAPKQAQAYEILAWVEACAEKPSGREINFVQAHLNDVRDRAGTLLALATVRVRVGDLATAQTMLDTLKKAAASARVSRGAERLEALIERKRAQAEPVQ